MRMRSSVRYRVLDTPQPFARPEGLSTAAWRREIEEAADPIFEETEGRLNAALQAQDMDGFWEQWSSALHSAFDNVAGKHEQERDRSERAVEQGVMVIRECEAMRAWQKPVARDVGGST
eukprot:7042018-Alexandrium_andersonii.AAC.1